MSETEVYRRALEFIRALSPGGVASEIADLALEDRGGQDAEGPTCTCDAPRPDCCTCGAYA